MYFSVQIERTGVCICIWAHNLTAGISIQISLFEHVVTTSCYHPMNIYCITLNVAMYVHRSQKALLGPVSLKAILIQVKTFSQQVQKITLGFLYHVDLTFVAFILPFGVKAEVMLRVTFSCSFVSGSKNSSLLCCQGDIL